MTKKGGEIVKRAKTPTYNQKKLISKAGLEVRHWQVISEDKYFLVIIHRDTEEIKRLEKETT